MGAFISADLTGATLPAGMTKRSVTAVGSVRSLANVPVTIVVYLSMVVQNEAGVTQDSGQATQTLTLAPGQSSAQLTLTKQVALYGGWKVFGQVFLDRVTPQPATAVAASQLQAYTEPISLGVELVGFGPGVAGGVAGLPNGTRNSTGIPSEYDAGAGSL